MFAADGEPRWLLTRRLGSSVLAVLAVIYLVPFVVYGATSAVTGLQPPDDGTPVRFLMGVLLSKAGLAVTFVVIFYISRDIISERWFLYAGLWWLMFVVGEVGQAVGPGYSWTEALAGIVSETIYCPTAGWMTRRLIGRPLQADAKR